MNSIIDKINSHHIILASQSPRRKQLLNMLGINFEIQIPNINEDDHDFQSNPSEMVRQLSINKAQAIKSDIENTIIIAADTTVTIDNTILNKPLTTQEAFDMLNKLSGKTHSVFTGYSILFSKSKKLFSNSVRTDVTFHHLTNNEIENYIATGSPMDKAGAYGIQDDFGSVFIKSIHGDYYNVVGFPVQDFYQNIKQLLDSE